MRKIVVMFSMVVVSGLLSAHSAFARPVLLELFTSQGCSSCPTGEKEIAKLNKRDDFFALSYHVDYWDRLGWKDPFAKPQFTRRQTGYMNRFGSSSVYTPQTVVDGVDETVASWGWRVKMLASSARDKQVNIPIHYSQKHGSEFVKIASHYNKGEADVWYVTYIPKASTAIKSGENTGRELHSVNVVHTFEKISTWRGKELELALPPTPEGMKLAVLIQEKNFGKVLGLYRQ